MAVAVIEGHGEWRVKSESDTNLVVGHDILVLKKKGNYLIVKPTEKKEV